MWICISVFSDRVYVYAYVCDGSHVYVSTDMKIRRVLVAFSFVSVRPSFRVIRHVYVFMFCLDYEIRAPVSVHEFFIRRRKLCRDNAIVFQDILVWSERGSWNFFIRIVFMSWSSRIIAKNRSVYARRLRSYYALSAKSHTEEHMFLDLTEYNVIDDRRDDEGENKDDEFLSQR